MTIDSVATLALSAIALICYVVLILRRIHDDHAGSRFLFVDVILAIAALEVLADTLGWHGLALLCQGAVIAGGMALLATYRKGG